MSFWLCQQLPCFQRGCVFWASCGGGRASVTGSPSSSRLHLWYAKRRARSPWSSPSTEKFARAPKRFESSLATWSMSCFGEEMRSWPRTRRDPNRDGGVGVVGPTLSALIHPGMVCRIRQVVDGAHGECGKPFLAMLISIIMWEKTEEDHQTPKTWIHKWNFDSGTTDASSRRCRWSSPKPRPKAFDRPALQSLNIADL
jgi:hypothetical protein